MSTSLVPLSVSAPHASASRPSLGGVLKLLGSAVADAENGSITNARKLEALSQLEELLPSLQRPEAVEVRPGLEDLCEQVLAQNATDPLRRLVVSVLDCLYRLSESLYTALPTFIGRLLKLTGDQSKKGTSDTKVAALDVIGRLSVLHGRVVEPFCNDVLVVIAKHMKMNEASARSAGLQCMCSFIMHAGTRSLSTAGNVWKILQKMLPDKALTVRTAAAQALTALVVASPECTAANGEAMALSCLKMLATEDPSGLFSAICSESRFAFAVALAQVLAAMASPAAAAAPDRPKKRPAVVDFQSAVDFLEQAMAKGPMVGQVFVSFRASVCLAAVQLAEAHEVADASSLALVVRAMLTALEPPASAKALRNVATDDEALTQVARHLSVALHRLLRLAEASGCLNDLVEQGIMPIVSAQFNETARSTDMRMLVLLDALCGACVASGEGFRSLEAKVTKPLLHIVGNYPNPMVQLHAAYCLRCVAHGSPPQLYQLMSVLLKMSTVQNAEILGTPLPRARDNKGPAGSSGVSQELQPLLRGLFGHCAALAALSGELYRSELGVPHDVTSAVLGTSRALLQPHPCPAVSAQRRSCGFLLLEGLMCLGSDWLGQRLTTLFDLWKSALGKKPVDRAKVLYQEHVATSSAEGSSGADSSAGACRDELLSLLFALRSLYAFTWHSRETLLTSLPHLHKILVVFLTNISQLVVALPHPTSATLRAKYADAGNACAPRPVITISAHCGIPEILFMIRATMYRTFASMQPSHYSSRFVPLLNMLADDVSRPLPVDFPVTELLAESLHRDDVVLDLVDSHLETSKACPGTTRLAVNRFLAALRPSSSSSSTSACSSSSGRRAPGIAVASHAVEDEVPAGEDLSSAASASSAFSAIPRESPGGSDSMLTPWDAWFDSTQPLVGQCVSPEWDWRCSSVKLLAIIMNASEVGEAPRAAVLLHLLKSRKESLTSEEASSSRGARGSSSSSGAGPAAASAPLAPELHVVSSIAVLAYLCEHVRVRGLRVAPPAGPMEQVMQLSLAGLKEANPALRRLHVEVLALLFFAHHKLPESSVVPTILQHASGDSASSDAQNPAHRSALALLCGVVLRTFAWAGGLLAPQRDNSNRSLHCPYLMNLVPSLLRMAKETSQPVRLWMLYSLHLSMEATAAAFSPFLKDALRLATAHLLADFFESPLVLWAIAEIAQSAALTLSSSDGSDMDCRDENLPRVLSIWSVLRHVRYAEPDVGSSFALVRAEVLGASMAHPILQLTSLSGSSKDVTNAVIGKLAPARAGNRSAGGSPICAVRAAASSCLANLATLNLLDEESIFQEPSQLFVRLNASKGAEASMLQELILVLLRQRGLRQLHIWLQALKEPVLGAGTIRKEAVTTKRPVPEAKESEDRPDEMNDEESMAGQKAEDSVGQFLAMRVATKVFTVSCIKLLVEQAYAEDKDHFHHFQAVAGSESLDSSLPPGKRLVSYLEILINLSVQASSSDEVSLALAGLKLMLVIMQRFQHTRDVQAQVEGMQCPLLLAQFEAQVTTCIRHNLRSSGNPLVCRLALHLLCDAIMIRACSSTQRLIAMLMQPLTNPVFEPDPLFGECASTGTFLFRVRCACAVLDSPGQQLDSPAYSRDIARWIEHCLRDGAVLMAGLPLQSVKTYKPACFSISDSKAVQPFFREAVLDLLRGICALCAPLGGDERGSGLSAASAVSPQSPCGGSSSSSFSSVSKELVSMSLGVIVLLLGVRDVEPIRPSGADLRVFIRTIRQLVTLPSVASGKDVVLNLVGFLDLMNCVWQHVFRIPRRCAALLPEMLHLVHAISGALWRRRTPGTEKCSGANAAVADVPWLEGLCSDSVEGGEGRAIIGAYAVQIVAASLRCEEVVADVGHTSKALEVLVWWLGDSFSSFLFCLQSLRLSLNSKNILLNCSKNSLGSSSSFLPTEPSALGRELGDAEDDLVAAALQGETGVAGEEMSVPIAAGNTCYWLWLLFFSPFPEALVERHPALTLKYWKMVCALLSSERRELSERPESSAWGQLLYLALLANKILRSLLAILEVDQLSEESEKSVVYSFATLVPAVSSMAVVLQQQQQQQQEQQEQQEQQKQQQQSGAVKLGGGIEPLSSDAAADSAKMALQRFLLQLRQVFTKGLGHSSPKVVQTVVSSAHSLLQNPAACVSLCPVILPCLVAAVTCQPPSMPPAAFESAWGAMAAMLAAQQQAGEHDLVRGSTQLVLRLVLTMANFHCASGGGGLQTSAMASCLVQVAQIDQPGLKAEVAAMAPESRQTIQQLLREHMSATGKADSGQADPAGSKSPVAAKKIDLKMKF